MGHDARSSTKDVVKWTIGRLQLGVQPYEEISVGLIKVHPAAREKSFCTVNNKECDWAGQIDVM